MTGRFAPSPTGRMHLGNILSALVSWLAARSSGGRWILRIEDLDPQRSRPEYARQIEDDLRWLGLDWDEGGIAGSGPAAPYLQSERGEIYSRCLNRLIDTGMVYPCRCSRAEIMAASAPQQGDGRRVYPGICRPASLPARFTAGALAGRALRLAVPHGPDGVVRFTDAVAGVQSVDLPREVGDFVLRRADGAWAYQLAVVVDDALMGVRQVVRGNDLLTSAAQQILLYRLLGLPEPSFAHIPLVCNAAGVRLSKRDGSASLQYLRPRFSPAQIIGRLAFISGLKPDPSPCTPGDLIPSFSFGNISTAPILKLP